MAVSLNTINQVKLERPGRISLPNHKVYEVDLDGLRSLVQNMTVSSYEKGIDTDRVKSYMIGKLGSLYEDSSRLELHNLSLHDLWVTDVGIQDERYCNSCRKLKSKEDIYPVNRLIMRYQPVSMELSHKGYVCVTCSPRSF